MKNYSIFYNKRQPYQNLIASVSKNTIRKYSPYYKIRYNFQRKLVRYMNLHNSSLTRDSDNTVQEFKNGNVNKRLLTQPIVPIEEDTGIGFGVGVGVGVAFGLIVSVFGTGLLQVFNIITT
jgi:hypothetical protein